MIDKDILWEVLSYISIAAIILLFIILFSVIYNKYECDAKWQNHIHRYKIIGGCQIFVPHEHKWIPSENYRVF